jgi:transposase-like protein
MADDYRRIELITGEARRRHWTTEQKLQIIEESFLPGETVSSVARRRGVAPNLLYRWRRLLTEGGAAPLEAAGVIFVEENSEGPGVRLRKAPKEPVQAATGEGGIIENNEM